MRKSVVQWIKNLSTTYIIKDMNISRFIIMLIGNYKHLVNLYQNSVLTHHKSDK